VSDALEALLVLFREHAHAFPHSEFCTDVGDKHDRVTKHQRRWVKRQRTKISSVLFHQAAAPLEQWRERKGDVSHESVMIHVPFFFFHAMRLRHNIDLTSQSDLSSWSSPFATSTVNANHHFSSHALNAPHPLPSRSLFTPSQPAQDGGMGLWDPVTNAVAADVTPSSPSRPCRHAPFSHHHSQHKTVAWAFGTQSPTLLQQM
jgi:hypothetical protein